MRPADLEAEEEAAAQAGAWHEYELTLQQQEESDDPQRLIRADEHSYNQFVRLTTMTMNQQPSVIADDVPLEGIVPSASSYLGKTDVPPEGVQLTIRGFKREMVKGDDGEELKTVVYWQEPGVKPMILNKVNSELIGLVTGARTIGEAKGKRVEVWNDPSIMYGARRTGGLRLRAATVRAAAPVRPAADPLDDDIPFN